MLLRDALADSVSDVSADLPLLLDASRRDGVRIRRRRRVTTTVGAVAATAVVAAGSWVLVPGSGPDTARETGISHAPLSSSGPLSGETAPITGRGATAALVDAVDRVADGTFTGLSGADHAPKAGSSVAFRFAPDGGGPATSLFLNLQPIPHTEDPAGVTCGGDYDRYADCAVRPLPSGDVLRTYTDIGSESPDYVRRVAEVRSPGRGLRVIVGSSNTRDGETGIAGVEPGLTIEQLTDIVTQPWWELRRLPVEYVEAGERLAPYRDHGA